MERHHRGAFLVQPFGKQPPPVCQAWPQGSRNKLGLELALEVFLPVDGIDRLPHADNSVGFRKGPFTGDRRVWEISRDG